MTGQWLTPPPQVVHLDAHKVSDAVGFRVDRLAIFINDLGWRWDDGREMWCERGFPNDGGSIPGLGRLFGLDPYEGSALRGCGAHDAHYTFWDKPGIIYGRRAKVSRGGRRVLVPDLEHPAPARLERKFSDEMLVQGMRVDCSPHAGLYYRTVRVGGMYAWRKADSALVGGYAWAVMSGTCDQWVDHVIKLYGPGNGGDPVVLG